MSAAVLAVALEMHAHVHASRRRQRSPAGGGVGVKGGGSIERGAHFAEQPGPMATTATVVQTLMRHAAEAQRFCATAACMTLHA